MPPRSAPTARQQRLGAELRKLRERIGMSTQEAAAQLGVERPRISNTEAGRFGVSEDRLRQLACIYRCSDTALIDALAEMTHERRGQWWEKYRGTLPAAFQDMADLEHHSAALRTAQTVHIPGHLQTEDYARAVFSLAVPPLPQLERELRVAQRMERQRVLDHPPPWRYSAVIHEAALRIAFGGRRIALAQLELLLSATESETVEIRLIPFSAGGFVGAGQTVVYAEASVQKLDTVQLDTSHGPEFLHAKQQLANYRSLLDQMATTALSPARSRELIHNVTKEL